MCLISNYNNVGEDDQEQVLRDRGYTEEQIRFTLKDTAGTSFKSLNVRFDEKSKLKYAYFSYVINLYTNYQKGILPYKGSLVEQPTKIIEIFQVLDQLKFESEEKMRKKREKENNKSG